MTTTLYRGGRVHSPADPNATALLVTGDTVTWVGADGDAPTADTTVMLDADLVTPGFVDAHVHCTDTGISLSGLDLRAVRSPAELLDGVAAFAASLPPDATVLGHGWDESTWADQTPPTAAELDRAGGGRQVYLAQASVHSALCSTALLAAAEPIGDGQDGSGWVREQAHHAVREVALGSLTTAQRRSAQQTALRRAASLGIVAVHECGGPGTSSEDDFTALLGLGGAQHGHPEVYGYWGELMAARKARELGAVGAGGDLYADGALGSATAHLREPYVGTSGDYGMGFVTAPEVCAHLVECVEVGIPGGFHAIGDQAIATVLEGFRQAAEVVGLERLRDGRHRIEHVELADRSMIAALVEFGVVASMQPAFDRLWGGPRQLYDQRLGLARSLASNPMGAMYAVGVALAFGSDSPVTPMDPWGSVRAATLHHNPVQRLGSRAAFAAHTRGGWRAVGRDGDGVLVPGAPATFVQWSTPDGVGPDGLPVLAAESALPRCHRTVLRGQSIFDARQVS